MEKKKSKCDYILDAEPTAAQVAEIEAKINEVISQYLDVTIEFMAREQAAEIVDLSKLPEAEVDRGAQRAAAHGVAKHWT